MGGAVMAGLDSNLSVHAVGFSTSWVRGYDRVRALDRKR